MTTVETVWVLDKFVAGRPAAQGSKRHVGGGRMIEQSKAVAPWRTLVAWSVAQCWYEGPIRCAVVVELEFVMPRPSGTAKRSTPYAVKRPDIDKLQRSVLDALTGVCWVDDSQVVDIHARKRLAELDEQPGCLIQVGVFA